MSTQNDPLAQAPQPADRLHYATGVMLDAQDFQAEQTYHRGRLARALSYLHGSGTAAGLRVGWQGPVGPDEEVLVHPGVALDRLGRVIEVPREACIRLNRWYEGRDPDELNQGLHGAPYDGVVVDVFIRFVACERGKTPSFAAGPFDALDAVVPSRLRDYYELELVTRREADPARPADPWSAVRGIADEAARLAALRTAVFDAWREGSDRWTDEGPDPLPEHAAGQDPTSLFLARLVLPAAAGGAGTRPVRAAAEPVRVENESRLFAYPAQALAAWLGLGPS